jgi:hypothetical protein
VPHNVHAANLTQDDDFYNAQDGYTYVLGTDVIDILSHPYTQFQGKPSINCNDKMIFIPRDDWSKLSTENQEEIIFSCCTKRNARVRGNQRPKTPVQRVNVHDTQELANVNDIIENTSISY